MDYYTYAYLREDKTPYYIGKGKRRRAYDKYHKINLPPENRILILKRNLSNEEAVKHEKYMIAIFGRKDLGTGILHNKTEGGDGTPGRKDSIETCEKRRKSLKGLKHSEESKKNMSKGRMGMKLSEEHKKAISYGLTGCKRSEETKKKMSESAKKRGNNRKGTKHTEETKEKMRQAALKRRNNK